MERKRKIKINMLACIIILAGFISIIAISYSTYSGIIKDDIRNITKLTATNIYSDISNQLTKPIFVSLTMANDRFVEDWLKQERVNPGSSELQGKIKNYLNGLKQKYNYNSVFLVSENTKNYYHYNGINKVVSNKNKHDNWYYNFIDSNQVYDLDVDTDEANQNKLSVFINCRIVDADGYLLGVIGVGLEMNKLQDLLAAYKHDFMLEAMLFDKDGIVQVHSDTSLIQKKNMFDNKILADNKDKILDNKHSVSVLEFKEDGSGGYMISKYIDDLDWYLLVKKDTSILVKSFRAIVVKDMVISLLVLFFIMFLISGLIKNNDDKLLSMAKTDALTGLPNRRSFDEASERFIKRAKDSKQVLIFVLDIDDFKHINDSFGHLSGDNLISQVGMTVQASLKEKGDVFRWGGDEFTGYIYGSHDEIEGLVESTFKLLRSNAEISKYNATISMGCTFLQEADTVDTLLKRADKALYKSKADGKNRYKML